MTLSVQVQVSLVFRVQHAEDSFILALGCRTSARSVDIELWLESKFHIFEWLSL
jgi:hypothetical protein